MPAKLIFPQETIDQVIELSKQQVGTRKISSITGIKRSTIQRIQKENGIDNSHLTAPRYAHLTKEKICKDCGIAIFYIFYRHLYPYANFKYTSMEDETFKQCWSLSNLRPLSAKQNIKENFRR